MTNLTLRRKNYVNEPVTKFTMADIFCNTGSNKDSYCCSRNWFFTRYSPRPAEEKLR